MIGNKQAGSPLSETDIKELKGGGVKLETVIQSEISQKEKNNIVD